MKKSVLMVVGNYPARFGHTTVINNLCVYLEKLGYKTAIGAFSFSSAPPNNIEAVKLNKFKVLLKGVNYLNFDIIHSHEPRVHYFLLSRKPLKSTVYHYHGSSSKIQRINFKIMMALYRNRISKIISVSKAGISQMNQMTGKAVEAEVVYNGVNTDFYNQNLPQPYKKGTPQLLFVSGLVRHKKAIELINAIPEILRIFPTAHLQIVGEGKEYEKMKKIVEKNNLEKNIELTGRISDDELKLRYSSCDVYISASTFEVCPVPTLEAMACGKPLVLYNIEPHREIVEVSQAGSIFLSHSGREIAKKIEEVYKNRKELGANALNFAKNHDWLLISKQLDSIYEKLPQYYEYSLGKFSIINLEGMELFALRFGRFFGFEKSRFAKWVYSKYIRIQMWNKHGIRQRTIQGSIMLLNLDEPLTTRDLLRKGIHGYSVTSCFYNELKKGMIVFDIGANIGYYSLLASKIINSNSKVFAFEPNERTITLLQKNKEINAYSNIVIIPKAISNTKGIGRLYLDRDSSVDDKIIDTNEKRKTINIELTTVDEFIEESKILPDFIKIDVQGAEYLVFEGMKKLLHSKHPLKIISEFSARHESDKMKTFKEILKVMTELGFTIYYLKEPTNVINVKDELSYHKYVKKRIDDFTKFKFSKYDEVDLLFIRK